MSLTAAFSCTVLIEEACNKQTMTLGATLRASELCGRYASNEKASHRQVGLGDPWILTSIR